MGRSRTGEEVLVSWLRGVNVGGKNKLAMAELRAVYADLGLGGVRSYVQSGNLVFRGARAGLKERIEGAIEARWGFRPAVVLRGLEEMRAVAGSRPFEGLEEAEPAKVAVVFLEPRPAEEAIEAALRIDVAPERMRILGGEMYVYYPNGMGQTKFPAAKVQRVLGGAGTARNWNTVKAVLAMMEEAG